MKVALIEQIYGNKASLESLLLHSKVEYRWVQSPAEIKAEDFIILPGVGNALSALDYLHSKNWISFLLNTRQPVFGICLGYQIMFESLNEGQIQPGLKIFQGEITKLEIAPCPVMGWQKVEPKNQNNSSLNFEFFNENSFYFAHSFANLTSKHAIAETSGYTSLAENKNYLGCQFHPELSGKAGLNFFKGVLLWAQKLSQPSIY